MSAFLAFLCAPARALLRRLAALLLLGAAAQAAGAHALPGTAVLLDFGGAAVGLQIDAPLDQFELGFGHPLLDAPQQALERYPVLLPDYLRAHVQPVAPDGRPWRVEVTGIEVLPATEQSPMDIRASLRLLPPPGAPVRRFRLNYSVINHEVRTHTVLVFARSDWQAGVLPQQPELLGTVRWLATGVDIDRAQGSFWNGFGAVVRLGMQHILEGTDHLLFLLTLLLPAPLLRAGHRWAGYGGAWHAARQLGTLVTAFTLGHSATLLLGALVDVAIPSTPVEVAIALSVFVSALHAWRPLLRGGEAWVAAGFGLVHGLAFSQVVAGDGLAGWHKAAAVLGFNLGIECVQLLVVALVAPWLVLLARAGHYTALRLGGALFAAVAALAWMAERVSGRPNAVSALLEQLPDSAPWLLGALVLAAAVSVIRAGRPGRGPATARNVAPRHAPR